MGVTQRKTNWKSNCEARKKVTYTMGNGFSQGFFGMAMAPYQMAAYGMQTEMMIMGMLLVFVLLMCCCCAGFAFCWFCYNRDEQNRRRMDGHREAARNDDMTLKTIQVLNTSKSRSRPAYGRRS